MPPLPFITFEGSEGCGKSTQVQRLAARLQKLQIPFLVTREPGGTSIGETIRELLQFAPHNSAMVPETELLLFEASRSQRFSFPGRVVGATGIEPVASTV